MNSILWNLINNHADEIAASKFENLVYDSLSLDLFDDLIHEFKEKNGTFCNTEYTVKVKAPVITGAFFIFCPAKH